MRGSEIVSRRSPFTDAMDEKARETIAFPTIRALMERKERTSGYTEAEVAVLCAKAQAALRQEIIQKVMRERAEYDALPFPLIETAGDAYAELLEWLTGHNEVG